MTDRFVVRSRYSATGMLEVVERDIWTGKPRFLVSVNRQEAEELIEALTAGIQREFGVLDND